jgi:hypothetical protein
MHLLVSSSKRMSVTIFPVHFLRDLQLSDGYTQIEVFLPLQALAGQEESLIQY